MPKNLTNPAKISRATRLDKPKLPFKIAIDDCLENGYSFGKIKRQGLKDFDKFIKETIGKNLTISQVDESFLRIKGPVKSKEKIHGIEREVVHYGKDRKPFRMHGYYNENGYFVLTHIDPEHKKFPE